MRRMLFVLLIAALANACQKPTRTDLNPENAVVAGDFITKNYSGDAVQLYLRNVHNAQHKNHNSPAIDSQELVSTLKIFQAVYDLNTPETQYIFNTRKIHAQHCFSTGSILLKVDTAQPEIKQLAAGKIPTGHTLLDNILSKYQFDSVRLTYGYPQFNWLSINTTQLLNTLPIINELKQIPSILIAEQNGGCLDGDNIVLLKEQDAIKITFSEGGGDCPSGCTFRKYWDFRVKNGTATYLGTR